WLRRKLRDLVFELDRFRSRRRPNGGLIRFHLAAYNSIVTRTLCLACLALWMLVLPAFARNSRNFGQQKPAPAQNPPDESNPPEEDESVAPEKFTLNPLESERNIKVG